MTRHDCRMFACFTVALRDENFSESLTVVFRTLMHSTCPELLQFETCMQEAEHNACTSPLSHRMPIADIPLPDQLRHVQGALWHFTVVRCELNTFTQTAFTPLASEEDQQAAMQDCMRLHASMWSSAAVTKSTSTAFTVAKHSSHTFLLWHPCFPIVHLCL